MLCSAVVGSSSISSSSTRSSADSAAAANPSETVINGSPVVAVGVPLATVSTVATGHQNLVMVSFTGIKGKCSFVLRTSIGARADVVSRQSACWSSSTSCICN